MAGSSFYPGGFGEGQLRGIRAGPVGLTHASCTDLCRPKAPSCTELPDPFGLGAEELAAGLNGLRAAGEPFNPGYACAENSGSVGAVFLGSPSPSERYPVTASHSRSAPLCRKYGKIDGL